MPHLIALKIGHQNIHGNGELKLTHSDLVDKIKSHHIFGVQESKLGKNTPCPDVEGYTKFRSERKKKAKRISGGSVLYVKKYIAKGITKLSSRSNEHGDVIWIKLNRYFFGLEQDVLLCYAYIVPTAKKEAFDLLRTEIETNSHKGLINILGDLNSRLGNKLIKHFNITISEDQSAIKTELPVPKRNSRDKFVNSNGRKLHKIASDFDLVPANGSVIGDITGEFTCVAWNGISCNDMFLFHRSLLNRVNYFKVADSFDWYSDHKSVSLSLRVNIVYETNKNKGVWKSFKSLSMNWNEENIGKFKRELRSDAVKVSLYNFTKTNFTSTDDAANVFSSILSKIFGKVFKNKKSRTNRQRKKAPRDNFSAYIQNAKRQFKDARRKFSENITDATRRQIFIHERRKYKQAIYISRKLEKEQKINKVAGLELSDPKSFWKELKALISPKDNAVDLIDKEEWSSHFINLLNVPAAEGTDQQFLNYVKTSLPIIEREAMSSPNDFLNKRIEKPDLEKSVKDLKMNKSSYLDNISNEVIKHGLDILEGPLIMLYNKIISIGQFPKAWSDGIIVPLHKKDDKLDTNNYRGIVISSCLGKLFLRIITKRIDEYMTSSGLWSMNQCGFKKDHRTEDNLFLIRSLFEKYVKIGKKKLYIAFVDFSKFFDKINRHMLLYKLLKNGITGSVYNIIKNIYQNTTYRIRIGEDFSPIFEAHNGVKQGCCLSPTLSNIFQNDIHDIFDDKCDPISIGSIVLNSLSWADDLIIVSLSKEGLQNSLNRLQAYCQKWGLEVNILKTKIMVFANKHEKVEINYSGKKLEQVRSMAYLGFEISDNCNITSIIGDRIAKANKVGNMVLHALRTNKNVSSQLALSIFNKQISPILLYGCAVWSPPRTSNLIYVENEIEHINTRRRVNEIFTDMFGEKIPFEYARRVGKYVRGQNRRILIKLNNLNDKHKILRKECDYNFVNFTPPEYSDIDKVQFKFLKRSLNVSKFASNTAICHELGLTPMQHKAHSQAIKYFLRLENGTKNHILNECYGEVKKLNLEWYQGIQHLLSMNGFGSVWLNARSVAFKSFHKRFQKRLDDQFVQFLRNKIETSERFSLLNEIMQNNDTYKCQRYVKLVKNPSIREIFTKIRINFNILESSKHLIGKSDTNGVCQNCNENSIETPDHLFFECDSFTTLRNTLLEKIQDEDGSFNPQSSSKRDRLLYIFDLRCPENSIGPICHFVHKIYNARSEIS